MIENPIFASSEARPSEGGIRRPPPEVLLLLGGTLVLCAALLGAEVYLLDGGLGFPLDDSWIHLAFARNLAVGHGLVIDPGEPVAGSTGPLWTALAVPGAAIPLSDLLWMKLLGAGFHLGSVVLTWLLARRLGLGAGLSFLAAALTAGTGWLLWSALSGMEIPLFTFLTLAGMVLHVGERRSTAAAPPLSLAVFGLSALARPEGLLLLGFAVADRLLRFGRLPDGALTWRAPGTDLVRRIAVGVLLAMLAVVPVVVFYLWIGGSPLPTTYTVKTEGASGIHLPWLRHLHGAAWIFFRAHPWLAVLVPVGAVTMVQRLGGVRGRGLLPVLWLAGLPLAYSCIDPRSGAPLLGNFGRYMFPLFPVMVVVGVLGLEPLVRTLRPGRAPERGGVRGRRLVAVAALGLLVAPTAWHTVRTAGLYLHNVSDIQAGDVRMARWLGERLPPEAVIATMDIGAMGALLPNPIEDLAGIADPEVHDHIRQAQARGLTWQHGVLDFLRERRPDYVVVFPEWLPIIELEGSPYRRIYTLEVPDNITLGRDTLAVYQTPWTRYPLRRAPENAEAASGETLTGDSTR